MGFARTRRGARQLVNHGHITVNGLKVDIPSYLCKVGDVIALREKDRNLKIVVESLESVSNFVAFVKVDKEKKEGTFLREPERREVAQDINEAQVIEYYNKLL